MTPPRYLTLGAAICALLVAGSADAQRKAHVDFSGSQTVEASSERPAQVEHVALGSQYLIPLAARPTRIALGDPSIVDLKLMSGDQIRLVGLKAGHTNVTVWTPANPKGWTFDVVVGPAVAQLNNELDARGETMAVRAVSTPQGVTLEGKVRSLDARQQAEALAKSEDGPNVDDQLAVTDRRMVALEIRFAAVSVDTMQSLGINFQRLGNNFQVASGVPGSVSNFQLSPTLNVQSSLPISQAFNLLMNWPGADFATMISALSSVNLAQLLAQPTLMVRSGDQADFLAGGEIPIPVAQSGQTNGAISIEYRKYGVQLHVRATVLGENRIVLRVNPEVSELDTQDGLTLQGFNVPAFKVRSTDTTIELGDGQSFVLAGLMYSSHSNIEQKVPGLGTLPIIGDFFKDTQNSAEQQELVIIATPRLVSPMEAAAVPKLPGEGLPYSTSLGQMLLNSKQLDGFATKYGLAPP